MATGTITTNSTIDLGKLQPTNRYSNANLFGFTTQGTFAGATVSLQYSLDGGITKTAVDPLVTNHSASTESEFNVHNDRVGTKTYYLVTTGASGSTSINYMVQAANGEL